jgi:hypothetical protein
VWQYHKGILHWTTFIGRKDTTVETAQDAAVQPGQIYDLFTNEERHVLHNETN